MFGISFTELLVVMVVALIVFGPEKLPEIAARLGKLSSQLKRASDGFRREFYNSVYTPAKEQSSLLSSDLKSAKKELMDLKSDPNMQSSAAEKIESEESKPQ